MAYFRPAQPQPRAKIAVGKSRPVSPDDVIKVENLTKRFGRKTVVSELSFSVPPRTLFGFLGRNGAGKSTTLYMLLGLVRPSGGRISIFDESTRSLAMRGRIGAFIETPSFYNYLSGRKNLELLGRLTGTSSRAELNDALATVGLLERAEDKVQTYSDGMRQRLGIAQAILHRPDLLILDEPTNGLDPEGNRDTWQLLRRLVDEQNITALVSSHLLAEVEEYCDYVCVIDEGRQVACDTVQNLLTFPTTLLDVTFPDDVVQEAALRSFERAAWVRILGPPPSGANRTVRIEIDGTPVELSRLLRQNVIDVEAVVPVRRTLKDFFLALTGKGAGSEHHGVSP